MNNLIVSKVHVPIHRITEIGLAVALSSVLLLPFVSHADVLNRQLELGMSGSDVSALQTFLAQNKTLYPQGLVTGYFGFLTKSAVSNFQSANGLSPVGRVGPQTLPVLNLQMSGNANAPTISGVTVSTATNTATVNWATNENAKGVVYYSPSPLVITEQTNSAIVSGNTAMTDTNLRSSQSVALSGLQPNTVYYYLIYTTDQNGNVSVTWPSTFQTTN